MEKMNIDNLVKKLKEGTLTNSEIAYLLSYFKENEPEPEIRTLFQKVWDESSGVNKEIDSKWIYSQVLNKVDFDTDKENTILHPDKFTLRNLKKYLVPALRYAAVFILSFILYRLFLPGAPESALVSGSALLSKQYQKITVPYGSKTKVELPDGSVVILNSGSNLSYSSNEFNSDKRSLFLEGEGFFTVSKDAARPFYVNTHGMKVKVLGTTFNIKAYNDENIEEATLVTGLVEIYNASDTKETGKPILLRPNEKVVFDKPVSRLSRKEEISDIKYIEPITLKTLELQDGSETEQTISWKDNKLIFENESFSSLVIKIERWYDVNITVDYPELNSARFTGTFDNETVEQVMHALSTITPFNFEIRKNQIAIKKQR